MTADQVALIDWDESHVDVPDLDLVLPGNAAGLDDSAYDTAAQVSAAWEAAVCWPDEYSIRRLGEVRAVWGTDRPSVFMPRPLCQDNREMDRSDQNGLQP